MRLLALFAIVCGCLFIGGFLMAERVSIKVLDVKGRVMDIDVIVTVPSVTEEARWLALYGCSAEMDDRNQIYCNDGWEFQSTHPVRVDQRQYPFPIRSVPKGWLQFSAVVTDYDGKTLAAGSTRVIR